MLGTVEPRGRLAVLPAADLVFAGLSLPFVAPNRFIRLWFLVRDAIVPGGWFAGNFFGPHDSWAGDPRMTFCTGQEVRGLVAGFDVLRFDEVDEDGMAFSGRKHWHLFDVIARRPEPVIERRCTEAFLPDRRQ